MKSRLLIIALALCTLVSCEDILDITPLDKISAADMFTDEILARQYLNGVYIKAFPHGLYRTSQLAHATDEMHTMKDNVKYKLITTATLTPDNHHELNEYLANWMNSYAVIRDANTFLKEIEEAEFLVDIKNEMIGEMSFVRAFTYANLIWRYGGVPLITKTFTVNDDFSISRNSYDDCVDFILDDIETAIANLPDKLDADNLGRISADAARALKARVLLYAASSQNNPSNDRAKWQAASDAAKELIDTRYSLYDDYHGLFLAHNSEVIFARYHSQASKMEISLLVGRKGDGGFGSDYPSQNIVDDYEMTNGQRPYLPDGSLNPTSGYDPQNPYINRDPRFHATILYDGSVWMERETETFYMDEGTDHGLDTRIPPEPQDGTMSGYYTKKFVPEDVTPTRDPIYAESPWIMFRYAEVLLNYAEAELMLGNEGEARKYLNMVRARPGVDMPEVTDTGDALLERIRNERRIELVFEGHRYFDVRRWRIAHITESIDVTGIEIQKKVSDGTKNYTYGNMLIQRFWDDRLYLLPIPYEEITRSNGSLEQNPGYN